MDKIPANEKALGLLETQGLVGAIEAADAMVKAAKVKLHPYELSTGALVVVKITGEVGAVRAAVDAGAVAAKKVGQLISTHIIPRPHDETANMVFPQDISPGEETFVDFRKLTVRQMRAAARNMPDIRLSGREISIANKDVLLKALNEAQGKNAFCRFPSK